MIIDQRRKRKKEKKKKIRRMRYTVQYEASIWDHCMSSYGSNEIATKTCASSKLRQTPEYIRYEWVLGKEQKKKKNGKKREKRLWTLIWRTRCRRASTSVRELMRLISVFHGCYCLAGSTSYGGEKRCTSEILWVGFPTFYKTANTGHAFNACDNIIYI